MRNILTVCLSLLSLVCTQTVFSQIAKSTAATSVVVPRLIRFGGVLTDNRGKILHGTVGMTLALYKENQGGAPLLLETQNVPVDEKGHYSLLLGATREQGVPMELFTSGEARWLGIQVEGQAEQPRVLLVSVPYALKAQEAETLEGKPASQFVSADVLKQQVQKEVQAQVKSDSPGKASTQATPTNTATTSGATNFSARTTDQVVSISQLGTGAGLKASAPSNNAIVGTTGLLTGIGVYGRAINTGTGVSYGVRGDSSTATGGGVRGIASGSSGVGVQATATGVGGTGALVESNAITGSVADPFA
jgi:hypothetical protein